MEKIHELYQKAVCKRFRGFEPKLKLEQAKIVSKVIDGRDTLSILPTGFGKSLCIFSPPIMIAQSKQQKCTCLIVSPLTSLAMQQGDTLQKRGQTVLSFTDREVKRSDIRDAFDGLDGSHVLFIIASPENLRKHWLRSVLGEINVVSISVDEGHCVSEWGESFRKDYRFLHELRAFTQAPVSVFTATVTRVMKDDIIKQTGLKTATEDEMIMSPERKEIYLETFRMTKDKKALSFILDDIKANGKRANKVLVFCATVGTVTDLYYFLRGAVPNDGQVWEDGEMVGCTVEMFFGKTDQETKRAITEDFCKVDSYTRVLIATTAFGMGINVEGLNIVVVYNTPVSAPTLMQMIGRCSRDGSAGKAMICIPSNPKPESLSCRLSKGCMRQALNKELCEPTCVNTATRCGDDVSQRCCTYCCTKVMR